MTHITITIDEKTLLRLGAYAQQHGLETSSDAISSLLDIHHNSTESKLAIQPKSPSPSVYYGNSLEIEYFPSGEENFRRQLLKYKKAHIRIHYSGGKKPITSFWNAQRFSESSSVRGNLASGYLRGWREKGICKAEISIEPFSDLQGGE